MHAEQATFRRVVVQVAGGLLAVLGLVFALSESGEQEAVHNVIVGALTPVGLATIALGRRGHQQLAVALLGLGVVPVVAWVHLFGARGEMAVMYLVPLLVMGMVAVEQSRAWVVAASLVAAALGIRTARWGLGIDSDFGAWLTPTFDAVAVIGITGLLIDLGLRRLARNEDLLQRAVVDGEIMAGAARAASDEKSAFLARVSHELRTPLNAILGYSELLQEEVELQEDAAQDLDRIHQSATQLLALIDAVLDLSKVEAGRLELVVEPVALTELVETVRATVEPLVHRNGNTLVVAPFAATTVSLDGPRVVQVLLNLLSNAARFTRDGEVRLTVRQEPTVLIFEVSDDGIGIPADRLGVLFQPFVQVSAQTALEFGGTGLGLSLCDRFVRQMGGHIEVQSAEGEGSTFRVLLPLEA